MSFMLEEPPWLQAAFDDLPPPEGDFSLPPELYADPTADWEQVVQPEPPIGEAGTAPRRMSDFEADFIGHVAQNYMVWEGGEVGVQTVLSEEGGVKGYEVDYFDIYRNPTSGDLSGKVLPLAFFEDEGDARDFRQELRLEAAEQGMNDFDSLQYVEQTALEQLGKQEWYPMQPVDWDLYQNLVPPPTAPDIPDEALRDPAGLNLLVRDAFDVAGEEMPELATESQERGIWEAFRAIGVDASSFDPTRDPPPLYDEKTGTSYWVGVYQPEADQPNQVVTSVLSLGRNEAGDWQALLAPCASGDWDHAYSGAQHLLQVAQQSGDVDQLFETAEAMAVATQHRELWDTARGIELEL